MWLDIGEFRAEQLLCPLNAQALQLVHKMAAAVVALAGQALGIFIGKNGAHGRDYRRRGKVFRSDQFNTIFLPAKLPVHHGSDFGIKFLHKANGVKGFTVHIQFLLSNN